MLGEKLFSLFVQLPKQYRRHGLTVYRRVVEAVPKIARCSRPRFCMTWANSTRPAGGM